MSNLVQEKVRQAARNSPWTGPLRPFQGRCGCFGNRGWRPAAGPQGRLGPYPRLLSWTLPGSRNRAAGGWEHRSARKFHHE